MGRLDDSHRELIERAFRTERGGEAKAAEMLHTRDHILACYEELSAYRLPHPGLVVPTAEFTGDLADINPVFVALLERFIDDLFTRHVQPKVVRGAPVLALELCR